MFKLANNPDVELETISDLESQGLFGGRRSEGVRGVKGQGAAVGYNMRWEFGAEKTLNTLSGVSCSALGPVSSTKSSSVWPAIGTSPHVDTHTILACHQHGLPCPGSGSR